MEPFYVYDKSARWAAQVNAADKLFDCGALAKVEGQFPPQNVVRMQKHQLKLGLSKYGMSEFLLSDQVF